jgi:putative chitinase
VTKPTDPKAAPAANKTLDALVAGCNENCPRCHAKITSDQVQTMFPRATADRVDTVRDYFNQYMENVEIIRCLRKAHFFAQILGEIDTALSPLSENLHYSRARMLAVFGSSVGTRRPGSLEAADTGSEEAIGNALYAGMNGNGNIASGDGYRYRGRGYIQITGRGTYAGVQGVINTKMAGAGIDVEANPDEASTPKGAIISAMGYWYWKELNHNAPHILNTMADQGDANATVNQVTHTVRGGRNADIDARRVTAYQTTMRVFRTPECVDRNKPSSAATPWVQNDGVRSDSVSHMA